MMTPIACAKVRIPALTKPIVAKVVAVEDCTIKVQQMPESTDLMGEPVNLDNQIRKVSPAISFKLSVIMVIPIKNRPIPPHNCTKTSNTLTPCA